ncbi:PepSY-associated TM helix domain-containing protein [Rubrivivax benzoatilyticus]|uniref:PepSY domain-containing protein n=1 Tax=Rubrivivax benzoatilyticus TaxID=316997 RepID=A0ABX0I149_9BURK|nr:PepSY-associated TM helix domain-containing protein [Rubrivivax benzoatilyticus]EGJ10919.1 PepSY-associated TM helix family protein 10 [Rubrivivax benzoatilyticus JA2 = ATCC BAA-35]NHK99566.1 PepSY domain-containing protein [Rubrivivax benzoatilyticus]NHL25440.1 PepSY domain-containing protein [Rubrivivax benzoatilyticus]
MRTDFIRVYKSVHTWTGIVAGLALFIAFYAGALTVFKEPLQRWSAPPAAGVEATPLAAAPELIARTLAAHPQAAEGFSLHLVAAEHRAGRLSWDEHEPGADDHDELAGRRMAAVLDAGGALRSAEADGSRVAEFIDVLHRVVGLPVDRDEYRWLMGAVCVAYVLALVSGVVVLLPTLVKDFFALRLGRNLKRMWLDAHNVVGIVSLPFHLLMALTAVGFAFHDGIYALQDRVLHDGRLGATFAPPRSGDAPAVRDPAAMLAPALLVEKARALALGFEPTMLQYARLDGPRPTVRIWGRDAATVSPRVPGGFAVLDPYTGRVLSTDYLPRRQTTAFTAISTVFALHFATFGGTPLQWMYFVLGLAGAWLFYSGNLLWVESRRKARRGDVPLPAQRRDVRAMAALTVGVALGCVVGISATLVAGKWLYGRVEDLTLAHQLVYYAVFFGAIAWAFVLGAARASVHLLWAAAAATAAIPATTLAAWALPTLGLWAHGSGAALGVDLTAAAGALVFVVMARATARRVRAGAEDSVWSGRAAAEAASGPAAAA